jgi:LacI family transcriptional regulator
MSPSSVRRARSPAPPLRSAGPATLQDIADATGVHRSTAARALDPKKCHLISEEVVARVREEARRLAYRRDAIAASLRTGRSRLVGVVVPDMANPVFAPILGGIAAALAEEGYSVLVADAGTSGTHQIEIVEQLIARRVDGLVVATARRDKDPVVSLCLAAGVPTVLVNRAEDRPRAPAVVADDIGGMALAITHLVQLGHERIGHLAGPENLSTGVLRRLGFEEAMRGAGLDPSAIATASAYTREAGRAATSTLLDQFPDLTAIAASNDLLALGAYQELRARGLSCPADLSIVGHNDMPLVDMVDPPLTTISIRQQEMGRQAAVLLLQQMTSPVPSSATATTNPELIVRGSTQQLRARRPSKKDTR